MAVEERKPRSDSLLKGTFLSALESFPPTQKKRDLLFINNVRFSIHVLN